MDPGARALPALGHADDLASRDGHLARAEPRVAQQFGPGRRLCRPAVHRDRGRPWRCAQHSCDRFCIDRAQPKERLSDVCLRQDVPVRHEEVQPDLSPGRHQDRTPSASAANKVQARRGEPLAVEVRGPLRAPDDDRRGAGDADPDDAAVGLVGQTAVKRGRGGPALEDAPSPIATRRRLPAQSPTARPRTGRTYGAHSSRTSPLAASSHKRERGARGTLTSLKPASSSSLSSLRLLQRRQHATTLSQLCVPPRLRGTT